MAGIPIKFRCFQCNQLLGVSRSKAGAVVSCPRCSAELIVPEPTELQPESEAIPGGVAAGGTASGEPTLPAVSPAVETRPVSTDGGIPLDFLDIRPEDIRVEPGVVFNPGAPPAAPEFPPVITEGVPVSPAPSADVPFPPGPPDLPAPKVPEPPPAPPLPPSPRLQEPGEAEVVPPIRVDAPSGVKSTWRTESTRSRDLIVPRSVVAAWSLFVILALGFAFIAGLLAGHFVWRVH